MRNQSGCCFFQNRGIGPAYFVCRVTAICLLYQFVGDGRFIASALGVWAMIFLGKKLGAIFSGLIPEAAPRAMQVVVGQRSVLGLGAGERGGEAEGAVAGQLRYEEDAARGGFDAGQEVFGGEGFA